MKLTYLSVRDYRSIAKAELSNLGAATILIGPNNEGKSSVLQGLHACLNLLTSDQRLPFRGELRLRYDRDTYDWATDYPIRKQASEQNGTSQFQLHFQLSESEKVEFQQATCSKLNGVLKIALHFGSGPFASFKVLKQGKGGAALSKKAVEICKFVSHTRDFAYIPAVRTADASVSLVNDLVRRELRQLEKDTRYSDLQKEIANLQRPILDGLAAKLKADLQKFLGGGLKDVSLTVADRYRSFGMSKTCKITIDDGTPTLLERKGDGVQSLVAISLMAGALNDANSDKDIILLIEEPESHLHPRAIHQLREVLETMRQDNQLFVTTHCPLLINRASVPANLIVSKNKATPAKSLTQLREVLGVRASDNLQHAALVIVVEGPEDEAALRVLLAHYSVTLKAAFAKGSLAFQVLGGASKLPYMLSLLQSFMCNYYAFLDDDEEGRRGYAEAEKSLLTSAANTTFTKCLGLPEAEFEDLLSEDVYADYLNTRYSVNVRHAPFTAKMKWSKRIREGLRKSGKSSGTGEVWPEKDEYEDKRAIADLVAKNPQDAIHTAHKNVIGTLVGALETKLEILAAGKVA
jgi:putative ATP-dependent endonuclease of OLD family